MAAPSVVSSSDTEIILSWSSLTGSSTGNSAILTYNLYWDNGSRTVNLQLIDQLVFTCTVSGLTSGSTYQFQVRASNIYGYGSFSNSLTVQATDVPSQINIPVLTQIGTNVIVTWIAPPSHG